MITIELFEKKIEQTITAKHLFVTFDELYFDALRYWACLGAGGVDSGAKNFREANYWIAVLTRTHKELCTISHEHRENARTLIGYLIRSKTGIHWLPTEIRTNWFACTELEMHNILTVVYKDAETGKTRWSLDFSPDRPIDS